MKKYLKPAVEIEMFNSTDIITLSGTGTQLFDEETDGLSPEALGLTLK